jgi:hypothetical protein
MDGKEIEYILEIHSAINLIILWISLMMYTLSQKLYR